MARLNPGDATTDFFLLLSDIQGFDADAPGGDGAGFAVFGEIVAGRDVAEKIYAAPVSPTAGAGPMQGQILDPMVTIKSARRLAPPPLAEAPQGCVAGASRLSGPFAQTGAATTGESVGKYVYLT